MQYSWEIWVDTNISPIIAKWIFEHTGYTAKSSYSLNLHQMQDVEIFNLARNAGNVILLSKDADFPDLISRLGSPPKLINVKIGNCDNRRLWSLMQPGFREALEILTATAVDIIDFEQ